MPYSFLPFYHNAYESKIIPKIKKICQPNQKISINLSCQHRKKTKKPIVNNQNVPKKY